MPDRMREPAGPRPSTGRPSAATAIVVGPIFRLFFRPLALVPEPERPISDFGCAAVTVVKDDPAWDKPPAALGLAQQDQIGLDYPTAGCGRKAMPQVQDRCLWRALVLAV